MSFKSEEELEKIRAFAKSRSIKYEPLPDNYIDALNSGVNKHLNLSRESRSCSVEFLNISNNDSFYESDGLSNAIFNSSLNLIGSNHTASKSLAELANGNPKEPKEYMKKLKDFFGLKEIAPIVALALFFGLKNK